MDEKTTEIFTSACQVMSYEFCHRSQWFPAVPGRSQRFTTVPSRSQRFPMVPIGFVPFGSVSFPIGTVGSELFPCLMSIGIAGGLPI